MDINPEVIVICKRNDCLFNRENDGEWGSSCKLKVIQIDSDSHCSDFMEKYPKRIYDEKGDSYRKET